jgi:hypothetical protein
MLKAILINTGEFGSGQEIDWRAMGKYTGPMDSLTKGEASKAIEALREYENDQNPSKQLDEFDYLTGRRVRREPVVMTVDEDDDGEVDGMPF